MVFNTPYHINFLQVMIWTLTKIFFFTTDHSATIFKNQGVRGDWPTSPALAVLLDTRPLRMTAPPLAPNIKSLSAKDKSHPRRLESSTLL
jgi:hypothetical protein